MRKALVPPCVSCCHTTNSSDCSSRKELFSTRTIVAICNSFYSFRKRDLRNPNRCACTNVSRPPEEKNDEFRTHATRSVPGQRATLFCVASNGNHRLRVAEFSNRTEPRRRS